MKRFFDAFPSIMFCVACVVTFVLFGYVTRATGAWPDRVISEGWSAGKDMQEHVLGYLGIEPTRHVYNENRFVDGVSIANKQKMEPGVTFITGFFDASHIMKIVDHDGNELHRWTVSFSDFFPTPSHIMPAEERPRNNWMTHIHGAYPFPDGSVIFNFDLHGLARIDACGRLMWTLDQMTHHSVSRADDGTFWVPSRLYHTKKLAHLPLITPPFFEDQVLQIDEDGTVLQTISLTDVLYKNDMFATLFANGVAETGNVDRDYMHTNDAQVLSRELASAFPMFEAGDIALSMRNLNLVMVFDPDTLKVKWHQIGPWLRQHDPDFLPDGTISVFDNRADGTLFGNILKGSRIVRIDPKSRATSTVYRDPKRGDSRRFFTNIMGKHETLPNGNLLITEALGGRIIEVTANGEIVWQLVNRYDEHRIAHVTNALRYPEDHFEFLGTSCETADETS